MFPAAAKSKEFNLKNIELLLDKEDQLWFK